MEQKGCFQCADTVLCAHIMCMHLVFIYAGFETKQMPYVGAAGSPSQ